MARAGMHGNERGDPSAAWRPGERGNPMVIVGVVLVLAYMAFVVAMIVRGDSADRKPTPWPRLEGFLLRPRARLVPLRARMAGLVGRKRADPAAGDESLRRPLEAYEAALNSALATVAALDPDFGAR